MNEFIGNSFEELSNDDMMDIVAGKDSSTAITITTIAPVISSAACVVSATIGGITAVITKGIFN